MHNFAPYHHIKEATIVIGPTGFGKSTFLTWMDPLKRLCCIKKGVNKVLQAEEGGALTISHDQTTGTFYPTPIVYQHAHFQKPLFFCDCPGFGDVRGSFADILNMSSLTNVLRQCDQVKVLLVLSGKTLEETRQTQILDLLNQTCKMFFKDPALYPNGAFILTKFLMEDKDDYLDILKKYTTDLDNILSLEARQWISYCIDQIDILRSVLGSITMIGGQNIMIDYDMDQWIKGFPDMIRAVNSLWDCVKSPHKTQQDIVKESFDMLTHRGVIKETVTFQLPENDLWNGRCVQTIDTIDTLKSSYYKNNDADLSAKRVDRYTLFRDGFSKNGNKSGSHAFIEEESERVVYKNNGFDVLIVPNTFYVHQKKWI